MDRKDIEYYKDMEYEVILRKKRGNFVLVVPELCIVEEDKDLGKAYEKLESKKKQYFSEMIEDDFEEYIRKPKKTIISEQFRDKFRYDLPLFGIKFLIVFSFIFIGGSIIVENRMNNFENKLVDRFFVMTNQIIDRAPREIALKSLTINDSLQKVSEERKTEIRLKIRDTVKELKPFFYELSLLFENPEGKKSLKESGAGTPAKGKNK